MILLRVIVLGLALDLATAWAHEIRPAFLEIKKTTPNRYEVLWRTPLNAGMRLPIVLRFPDDVHSVAEPSVQELTDSLLERRVVDGVPNGLAGKRIQFVGLQRTITDVLVRVECATEGTEPRLCARHRPGWKSPRSAERLKSRGAM